MVGMAPVNSASWGKHPDGSLAAVISAGPQGCEWVISAVAIGTSNCEETSSFLGPAQALRTIAITVYRDQS